MCVDDIVDIDLWTDTAVQTAVTAIREAEAISNYILLPGEAPLLPFCLTLPSKKRFLHTKPIQLIHLIEYKGNRYTNVAEFPTESTPALSKVINSD